MLWEVDVSDAVDGINLPVEILHGFDGVGIRDLGGCVDPEAACDWGWPGASLDALDAVHQQRRPRLVHREARVPPMVSPAIAASAAAAMVAGAESAAARVAAASHGADRIGGRGDRRPAAGGRNDE